MRRAASVFDVVVIGGGHAGCEAATAAARTGASTLLLTHSRSTIGEMSCNPSFGGIGKGHLMREVDALDGVCSRLCDQAAITFQALNRSHGMAVLGLRAQIDRKLYKRYMQEEIAGTPRLEVGEGSVEEVLLSQKREVIGVGMEDGSSIECRAVVIATGTFLGGEIFQGKKRIQAGRIGEKSSHGLSRFLSSLDLRLGRLRTGTPPRLSRSSIDFSRFIRMPPDETPIPFSFLTDRIGIPTEQQLPTYCGYTNEKVREIVQAHLHENEHIREDLKGPRYCPSLEAKILRFPQLNHRLFLEHEGLDSPVIYPQGMSITFEPDVQLEICRAIPGLEGVEITQPGYGVQYDFVDPKQLYRTLEVKKAKGLFLAGQINGTTGYEEAAAQGVIAGINASCRVRGVAGLEVSRGEGYIGVLIDDLTSLGTDEPYRMFTSRAEFRLHLRPDNADIRLTEKGRKWNAVGDRRWGRYCAMKNNYDQVKAVLLNDKRSSTKWMNAIVGLSISSKAEVYSAYEIMYRHSISLDRIAQAIPELKRIEWDEDIENRLRIDGSYSKMEQRLKYKMHEVEREAQTPIPEDIDFSTMRGLSMECMEKLERSRPLNLAAASRIQGVTPEAILSILRHIKTVNSAG